MIFEQVTAAIDEAANRLRIAGLTNPKVTIDLSPKDFARFMHEADHRVGRPAAGASGPGKPVNRATYMGRHVVRTGFAHGVLRDGGKA